MRKIVTCPECGVRYRKPDWEHYEDLHKPWHTECLECGWPSCKGDCLCEQAAALEPTWVRG